MNSRRASFRCPADQASKANRCSVSSSTWGRLLKNESAKSFWQSQAVRSLSAVASARLTSSGAAAPPRTSIACSHRQKATAPSALPPEPSLYRSAAAHSARSRQAARASTVSPRMWRVSAARKVYRGHRGSVLRSPRPSRATTSGFRFLATSEREAASASGSRSLATADAPVGTLLHPVSNGPSSTPAHTLMSVRTVQEPLARLRRVFLGTGTARLPASARVPRPWRERIYTRIPIPAPWLPRIVHPTTVSGKLHLPFLLLSKFPGASCPKTSSVTAPSDFFPRANDVRRFRLLRSEEH